jgi:hypothetical protein
MVKKDSSKKLTDSDEKQGKSFKKEPPMVTLLCCIKVRKGTTLS